MASTNSPPPHPPPPTPPSQPQLLPAPPPPPTSSTEPPSAITTSLTKDDVASKAVNKRYEALVSVRNKAIKGKGVWYWAHLEPILVKSPETNLAKAVKLKCSLCDAVFSASNPSRTASEHLKRGACPSFAAVLRPHDRSLSPLPLSTLAAPSVHVNNNCGNHNNSNSNSNRKRSKNQAGNASSLHQLSNCNSLALIESTRFCDELSYSTSNAGQTQQQNLVLSGGKEDLGALAMLEDSVKRLKSPRTRVTPALSKEQIESAVELLSDWFIESSGSVSFSALDHPKFKAFLSQVGLPFVSRKEILDARLDNKFLDVKTESESRIREVMCFQVVSDGWKANTCCGEDNLVRFTVNLPNGTSVFRKTVITRGLVSSKYAEEILWETVMGICGNDVQRCVGIVADKYKAKALKNLEIKNQWMVNISCQVQGFVALFKDFSKELPVLRTVTENCLKIANFVNTKPHIRNSLRRYKGLELDYVGLIQAPSSKCGCRGNYVLVLAMLEDILNLARMLQMVVLDDAFKVTCMEDLMAREVVGMIQSEVFWNELEAVYSLMKLIKGMIQEIEDERPLIGRCLPLWEEFRSKVKNWCAKFSISEAPIEKIIEKRFRKNYHPAWSAAFVLDPLYLMKDSSGKYLPPFKYLTHEQEKDVDKLITRLVSRDESHIALGELMKWRSEGLDPLYAQAVQVKQRDPMTGKMKLANPQSSRLVWETCLSDYKSLAKVAVRLIFLHATSCGVKYNWPFMKRVCRHRHSQGVLERAQKMIFVAANAKLERRDFSDEEEKDAELFATGGSEDEMLNDVFTDASSIVGFAQSNWMIGKSH